MSTRRQIVEGLIRSDGRVLICGGSAGSSNAGGVLASAEIYQP